MRNDQLAEAAARVISARLGGHKLQRLPEELGVRGLEDAYAVQLAANAELEAALGPRVGHKIGGTTESMRKYLNVPEPLGGETFKKGLLQDGATLRIADYRRPGVETEIAVRMAKPLPSRPDPYTREEVVAAIGALMPAIELVDDRYEEFAKIGAATIIADNAFNAANIVGTERTDWQALDLPKLRAWTYKNGALVGEGTADALYGDPIEALRWLANRLSSLGRGLEAGTFVSLGSITAVQWVDEPARYRIEVEGLGSLEVAYA
ncbi:MAG: fumarylacetoacetate hydrolase family protein [Geminicoccaceae bacterium]